MSPKKAFPRAEYHFRIIRQAVEKASPILLTNYGKLTRGQIKTKSQNDFVTVVDHQTQRVLVKHLRKKFPSYGFKAEEEGLLETAERTWVIDPLDGTSNYIHQIPAFCISIGLKEAGRAVLGLVYDPIHDEWFRASRGGGAFLNRRRIHVSRTRDLNRAFLATGFPFRSRKRFTAYLESFLNFFNHSRGIRRIGSAALDLCYTACGRFDGFWELGLKEWDMLAGCVLIEEAGGRTSDFRGTDQYLETGDMLAGNPWVHRQLKAILRKIPGLIAR